MVQAHKKRYDSEKSNSDYNTPNFVPRVSNPTFKRSGNCYVFGKTGYCVAQCVKEQPRLEMRTLLIKPKANLVEGEDVIVAVVYQIMLMVNLNDYVVDSRATKHTCANRSAFTLTLLWEMEKNLYR